MKRKYKKAILLTIIVLILLILLSSMFFILKPKTQTFYVTNETTGNIDEIQYKVYNKWNRWIAVFEQTTISKT